MSPVEPLPPPQFLFIETTTECNLPCRQCHMWMTEEPKGSLDTDEKVALVQELGAWSPAATVVLTGGETMKKTEEFFALSAACREHGLSTAANTNATFIDAPLLDRLLTEGPKYLVISLDSHLAEVHDAVRGRKGTHEQVVGAIVKLLERRKEVFPDSDVQIMTNTILFDGNVPQVGDLVEFLVGIGIDGIMFQALSRTFLNRAQRDVFFEKHFPSDTVTFDTAIETLLHLQQEGAPIVTTANDLGWMKLYARNPDFIGEQVCGSGERNMMVDQMGDVQLCFSMRGLMNGEPLGNVRKTCLRDLWTGEMAAEARKVMTDCRKNCGMLNCHRRL